MFGASERVQLFRSIGSLRFFIRAKGHFSKQPFRLCCFIYSISFIASIKFKYAIPNFSSDAFSEIRSFAS